jgi:hypothetical protein
MYASFLGISEALYMDIFQQPLGSRFFDSLNGISAPVSLSIFGTVDAVRVIFQGFLNAGALLYWSVAVD